MSQYGGDGYEEHPFFGQTILTCTFILAMIGWGVGFYGPPIYMQAVMDCTDWPVAQVSAAVTLHFLSGTLIIANLPRIYVRFGVPAITLLGSIVLAVGMNIWAQATSYGCCMSALPVQASAGSHWVPPPSIH